MVSLTRLFRVFVMSQQAQRTGQPDRSSPLRWALLGLLAERADEGRPPLHGYKLAVILGRRFGPGWKVTSNMVYGLLDRLVDDRLVETREASITDDSGSRKVYEITPYGRSELAVWRGRAGSMDSLVVDQLVAKIVASRPEDRTRVQRELAEHERACMDLLDRLTEVDVALDSWHGVAMNVARAAAVARLNGELRWNMQAQDWIESFPSPETRR
jgi:DNA-binding PadR family transcriptional regulator